MKKLVIKAFTARKQKLMAEWLAELNMLAENVILKDRVADLERRIAKAVQLMGGSGTPDAVLAALNGDT